MGGLDWQRRDSRPSLGNHYSPFDADICLGDCFIRNSIFQLNAPRHPDQRPIPLDQTSRLCLQEHHVVDDLVAVSRERNHA